MNRKKQSGQVLIISIVLSSILAVISASLFGYTALHIKGSSQSVELEQALRLAEAGVDKAVHELNLSQSYTGETGTSLGVGEFSVQVTDIDAGTKRVTSTGYVPTMANPSSSRTIKTTLYINTADIAFNFGVQVGEGGLIMDNNTQINGNVFSNGNVTGTGVVTGDVSVAAGVAASSDQECSTYGTDYVFSNNDNSKKDISQSFVPSSSGALSKVSLYLRKVGNPGNLVVKIMPTDVSTGKAARVGQIGSDGNFSGIGASYGWVDVSFTTAPTLTAGVTYWLVVDGNSNPSGNYYSIGVDDSYVCGGSGQFSTNYNGKPPGWAEVLGGSGADLNFMTYMGGVNTYLDGITVNGNVRAQDTTNCTVGADIYYEGVSTTCSVTGTEFPGTTAPSSQALPVSSSQVTDWKSAAAAGEVYNGDYVVVGSETKGPMKINGNLTFENGAFLYLTGVIWVTGNIIFSNNATIRVDGVLGNQGTTIVADGTITVDNNVVIEGNGNPNSYLMVYTTASGTDAMSVANNATGAIFYAGNGTVNVLNNAGGNQITGYAIHMNNNSSVTYSTGLQSVTFTTGPGGAWTALRGEYVIIK